MSSLRTRLSSTPSIPSLYLNQHYIRQCTHPTSGLREFSSAIPAIAEIYGDAGMGGEVSVSSLFTPSNSNLTSQSGLDGRMDISRTVAQHRTLPPRQLIKRSPTCPADKKQRSIQKSREILQQKQQTDFLIPIRQASQIDKRPLETTVEVTSSEISKAQQWWWAIFSQIYKRTGPKTTILGLGQDIRFEPNAKQWVSDLVGNSGLRDWVAIEQVWNCKYAARRDAPTVWANVTVQLLVQRRIRQMVYFLAGTACRKPTNDSGTTEPQPQYPSPDMVHSALKVASLFLSIHTTKFSNLVSNRLAAAISHILSASNPISVATRNTPLHYLLATQSTSTWLGVFYDRCADQMTIWTRIQWAYAFAHAGEADRAIRVIRSIQPTDSLYGRCLRREITKIGVVVMRHVSFAQAGAALGEVGETGEDTQLTSRSHSPELTTPNSGVGVDPEFIFLRLLKLFRRLGVRKLVPLYNAFIANAFEQGHDFTAIALFESVANHVSLRPDARTLSAMLRGLESRGDGRELRTRANAGSEESTETFFQNIRSLVLRSAIQMVKQTRNHVLALEVLHSEFDRLCRKEPSQLRARGDRKYRRSTLPEFWDVFAQIFDVSLAQQVGIYRDDPSSNDELSIPYKQAGGAGDLVPSLRTESSRTRGGLLTPTCQAMHLLLHVFACDITRSPETLIPIYERVFELITNGSESDANVSVWSSVYIFNTFLRAFGRSRSSVGMIPRVLKDLSGLSGREPFEREKRLAETPSAFRPTVHTCNILLNVFVRSGQMTAASKVRELMRKHKIEPTAMTWNTLIAAAASNADVEGVYTGVRKLIEGRERERMSADLENFEPESSEAETSTGLEKEEEEEGIRVEGEIQTVEGFSRWSSQPSWKRRPKAERAYERRRAEWELLPTTAYHLDRLRTQAEGQGVVAEVVRRMEQEGDEVWTRQTQ